MTERKLYRCDVCGVEYALAKDAQKCEEYHVAPMSGANKIKGLYKGMNQDGCDMYPYKVIITMSDGKQVEYRR
jgi:hypothetical protein